MTTPTDMAERSALQTLSSILIYVAPQSFTSTGLAKGLGRKLEAIDTDLKWLMARGYVAEMTVDQKKKMYVTHAGWLADAATASRTSEHEIVTTPDPKNEDQHEDDHEH